MINKIQPGTYVVAVSGGVDSMALLHMLVQDADLRLIVAHYDHGIRTDSAEDRALTQRVAKQYGLVHEYAEGKLGQGASEATAREARYAFLQDVRSRHNARAIITAHHQDDYIETAVLNLLRGTHRRGLHSLRSTDTVVRPLLSVPKNDIIAYAKKAGVRWREDSTNTDERYLRNAVRKRLATLDKGQRQQWLNILNALSITSTEIDRELAELLKVVSDGAQIRRQSFLALPFGISCELMAFWLRSHGILGYDRKTLVRVTIAAKTLQPGKVVPVLGTAQLVLSKANLALGHIDR